MRKDDETFADNDETLKIYSYNRSLTHRLRFCHGKIAITLKIRKQKVERNTPTSFQAISACST